MSSERIMDLEVLTWITVSAEQRRSVVQFGFVEGSFSRATVDLIQIRSILTILSSHGTMQLTDFK